jgi:XTP/dITP diphosphohydrolase
MTTLCLATNNANKVLEIKALLPNINWVSLVEAGISEELPEPHHTLEENSASKALYVWKKYGLSCLSDDSGLEVIALNGEPGVDSAFYAGPEKNAMANMKKLLKNLEGYENRSAQFRTIASIVIDGILHQFEGVVKGIIIEDMRGENGFGYDAIFIPENETKTFAEMDKTEKNRHSHRAKAMKAVQDFLLNTVITPTLG